MLHEPFFEIFGESNIAFLPSITCQHRCLVDCPVLVTCPRDWAFLLPAYLAIAHSLYTLGWVSVGFQDFRVMVGQLPAHVWQTSVAHFDSVSIYNAVEGVPYRKVLVHQK